MYKATAYSFHLGPHANEVDVMSKIDMSTSCSGDRATTHLVEWLLVIKELTNSATDIWQK